MKEISNKNGDSRPKSNKRFDDNPSVGQNHHNTSIDIEKILNFLEEQEIYPTHLAGNVLNIDYDKVVFSTTDYYKQQVGGLARNEILVMCEKNQNKDPSMILLRISSIVDRPDRSENDQTKFELQKKTISEIDPATEQELQWSTIEARIIGMLYPSPENQSELEFSNDLANISSSHHYSVFKPSETILDVIVNYPIKSEEKFVIGKIRQFESRYGMKMDSNSPVFVNIGDFLGKRSAMFGVTRKGKSNVVKILAQATLNYKKGSIGQIIFDINGEYSNDNYQDGVSLKSLNKEKTQVYSFNPIRDDVNQIRYNFYKNPREAMLLLGDLLTQSNRNATYLQAFLNANVVSIDEYHSIPPNERLRPKRRLLLLWAILHKAGYNIIEERLIKETGIDLNPQFRRELRETAYGLQTPPNTIQTLDDLVIELQNIAEYASTNGYDDSLLQTTNNKSTFEVDDRALLEFLHPHRGRAGVSHLIKFRNFHHQSGINAIEDIMKLVDEGKTVILDLSNSHPTFMQMFSENLATAIFNHQEEKFIEQNINNDDFVQMYFEEAHNIFPKDSDNTNIYSRLAKEGAKFHIGLIYSTQSVSSISPDLLNQTENIFTVHLASTEEVKVLCKARIDFEEFSSDILRAKSVGYVKMLTASNRFVIPLQAIQFNKSDSHAI